MLRKIRRLNQRLSARNKSTCVTGKRSLRLENLERRVLLDTAGWWDELGWRGASGGGVTWDQASDSAEAEMVLSVDGDPVLFWTEGTLTEGVGGNDGTGRMWHHYEMEGSIYARQYSGEELGWWDLSNGSGDQMSIGTGKELDAAAGPDGQIALTWVANTGDIYLKLWDGETWGELAGSASGSGISGRTVSVTTWTQEQINELNLTEEEIAELTTVTESIPSEKPSVAFSETGEIFVSYTSVHPNSNPAQREIVVKKYGYDFSESEQGPPQQGDLGWTELINSGVGLFGEEVDGRTRRSGGVSDDQGNSYDSSIAIDPDGRAIVAWVDASWEGGAEIVAKRWDGDSWEELGPDQDSGSASDLDDDGCGGISNDPTQSMQPDIAVADNGDVIVTWVNWENWEYYANDGQAGVFVKVLHPDSSVWEEYAVGSATGAGIAQDATLPADAVGLGWYYSPEIMTDSQSLPYIVWQGYGVGERETVNRSNNDDGDESPRIAVYASHYEDGGFNLLYDVNNTWVNPSVSGATPAPRGTANLVDYLTWMPAGVVGANDELIMAYTWHDVMWDAYHLDDEIFTQEWNTTDERWDSLGRGSMSNGNDIFGQFPDALWGFDTQMGLIDTDNDDSTEPDVIMAVPALPEDGVLEINGGHLYLYSRDTGQWSDEIDTVPDGFGMVFDLRGEPDYEYQVEGHPLLAYLDDITADPFVYEWVSGAWSLVGGGTAGEAGALRDKGISVQAGPNGTILLAYIQSNGISDDVIVRLWDPTEGSWTDAGEGTLDKNSPLEAAYYSEFTGYDFEDTGVLDDGDYDEDSGDRIYDLLWGWKYWDISTEPTEPDEPDEDPNELPDPDTDTRVSGSIVDGDGTGNNYVAGAGYLADGWEDEYGDPLTGGIEISYVIEEGNASGADSTTVIAGEVDHQFRLINDSYVIIEMMYQVETLNMDTAVYLVLDGELIDVDPSTPDEVDPITTVIAGETEGYSANTIITFDSKSLGLDKLEAGDHTVGLRGEATVTSPDLSVDFSVDPSWTFVPDTTAPAETTGAWAADAGRTGAGDGGLIMILDNSTDPDPPLVASFEYDFSMGGPVTISFDCQLQLDEGVELDESLVLMIAIDDTYITSDVGVVDNVTPLLTYLGIAADDAVADATVHTLDWTTISIKLGADDNVVAALEAMASGDHTLSFEARLSNDAGVASGIGTVKLDNVIITASQEAYVRVDNFSVYQRVVSEEIAAQGNNFVVDPVLVAAPVAGEWGYTDVFDPASDSVDGVWDTDGGGAGEGDGALVMALGDGITSRGQSADGTSLEGCFDYVFNLTREHDLLIDFSYRLASGAGIEDDDTLDLILAIDGVDLNTDSYQILGGSQDSWWQSISIDVSGLTGGGSYSAGDHTLSIRGVLSNSEASEDGTAVLSIDNVAVTSSSSFGTDPLADDWTYADVNDPDGSDPGGDVDGVWREDAGSAGAADDGGLKLFLGDGMSWVEELEGQFSYDFTTNNVGYVGIDLYYYLETGASIGAGDTLDLMVSVDGEAINSVGDYQIVSSGGGVRSSGWQKLTLTDIGPLTADTHTLTIGGVLTDSADGVALYSEAFSANVLAAGVGTWANSGDAATAQTWEAAGGEDGGGLQLELGDGATAGDPDAQFSHGYTLDHSDDLIIEFDYEFETNVATQMSTNTDETLSLEVWIDDGTTQTLLATIDSGITTNGAQAPGWQSDYTIDTSQVAAIDSSLESGLYTLIFEGVHTDTVGGAGDEGYVRLDNVDIYEKSHSVGIVQIDDVSINTTAVGGDWELIAAGGDTGGNDKVGERNDDDVATFDDGNGDGFQGDIHGTIAGAGTQIYVIEDLVQNDYGKIVVSFRYRLVDGDIRVLIGKDGVYQECDSSDPGGHPLPLDWADDEDWWNGDTDDTEYTWVEVVSEDMLAGTYTVRIELSSADGAADLWIDNLTILTTTPTSAVRPMATLSATGVSGGSREFMVGVMNNSPEVRVYADATMDSSGATEPWPDALIECHFSCNGNPASLSDGYTSANLFKFRDETWVAYGDDLAGNVGIDFLGLGGAEGSSMTTMPSAEVMLLEDIVVGPGQVQWVLLQRAEVDWVDKYGDDGVLDTFELHTWVPIGDSEDYWVMEYTPLTPLVWRWDNMAETPGWQDTGFVPTVESHAYTHMQMVSSGGQAPVVAWTRRTNHNEVSDSAALRWEGIVDGADVWGILGQSESVQNGDFWSLLVLTDMIVVPDGDPVVSFQMGHLDSYGIREFREVTELPVLAVTENSGDQSNDDRLEFGQLTFGSENPVDQVLTISNTGPGDLLIYDIDFGGYGDLENNPFLLVDPPSGFPGTPVRLEPPNGELIDSVDFIVRFDPVDLTDPANPISVPVGVYDSVLLINSNDTENSPHPFSHFYEVFLDVEIAGEADLHVDEEMLYLPFGESIINGGGLSDLTGMFRQKFTTTTAGDVDVEFDYRLLLGDRLVGGETLDMIVALDGEDITEEGDYQIVGGTSQDSGYQTVPLVMPDLTAGEHVLSIRGELSSSIGWGEGTGVVSLDNITIDGLSYEFALDPGEKIWSFVSDSEYPEATSGGWDAYAGATGDEDNNLKDGGLEMVLGEDRQVREFVLKNIGTSEARIESWIFDGVAFRILDEAEDGIAGAVVSRLQANGTYTQETASPENNIGPDDDVILQAGDLLTLKIVFEPTEAKLYGTVLYVTNDIIDNSPIVARLDGSGVGGGDLTVEFDGEAIPDFDPVEDEYGVIDFGSVIQGQSSSVVVTLRNNGSSDLTIDSVIEFAFPSVLQIDPNVQEELLAPGESIDVTLTYSPATPEPGAQAEVVELDTMLRIVSNDRDLENLLYDIQVVALGVPETPMIQLVDTQTGEPVNRLDFGSVYIGQQSVKTFDVKNIGGTDLELESFRFANSSQNVYVVEPENEPGVDGDITIAHGGEPYTITVTFAPTSADANTYQQFRVFYYDENNEVTYVPYNPGSLENSQIWFSTEMVGQQINVIDEQGEPILNDGELDFGPMGDGQTAEAQIIIQNVGSSDLTVTGWTLSGDVDVFSIDAFPGGSLVLGEDGSHTIDVEFTPDGIEEFDGTVTITSDDPNNATWTISLVGAGAEPGEVSIFGDDLTLTDPANLVYDLDFGDPIIVSPTSRTTSSFTIRNDGDSNLRLEALSVSANCFSIDSGELEAGDLIESGQEYEVSVIFHAINPFDSTGLENPPFITVTTDDLSGQGDTVSTIELRAETINASESNAQTGNRIKWIDRNGKTVQVILIGSGSVTAYPDTSAGAGVNSDIGLLELTGTSTNSMLLVIGPFGGTRIGGISGGLMSSIIMQNATLDGDMNEDGVEDDLAAAELDLDVLGGMLMLGDVHGGADINIGNITGAGASIRIGEINHGSDITIEHGNVLNLQVARYGLNSRFTVADGSVNMINISEGEPFVSLWGGGDAVTGDFIVSDKLGMMLLSRAAFSGTIQANDIGMLFFKEMNYAKISVRGQLRQLMCRGDMIDSLVLAGYDAGADGEIGTGDDAPVSGGSIGTLFASGTVSNSYIMAGVVPDTPGDFNIFDDTPSLDNLRTGSIGQVSFGGLLDTTAKFGVAAYGNVGGVRAGINFVTDDGSSLWDYFRVWDKDDFNI